MRGGDVSNASILRVRNARSAQYMLYLTTPWSMASTIVRSVVIPRVNVEIVERTLEANIVSNLIRVRDVWSARRKQSTHLAVTARKHVQRFQARAQKCHTVPTNADIPSAMAALLTAELVKTSALAREHAVAEMRVPSRSSRRILIVRMGVGSIRRTQTSTSL